MDRAKIIFTAQYCLPQAEQDSLIEQGGIAVFGDTIVEVGPTEQLLANHKDAEHIHEEHGLLMPGLINTHTHAPMACFRGFADDLPLMTWLQEHIFPVETHLNSDMVYTSTLLSIAEMIKSGTTSFCDMYLFAKDVARATDETGMRGWLGEAIYDFPSPNYGELENGFVYMDQLFEQYKDHPLITIATTPHSVYTCSPELLKRVGKVAKDKNALFIIHLSENEAEVNTCLEMHSARPVEHLNKLGLLHKDVLAAHCVQLSENDIQLLEQNQVKVTHCAESNMKLASGIAPVPEMLDAGITISIGTDGSASNNDVDMLGEMDTVAKLHKVAKLDPTVMNAEQTLFAATMGGAAALGAESMIGSLQEEKKADCIVLDLKQPHLTPLYNAPSHVVYVARGSDVKHSMINGKMVMKNRQLLTIDENSLFEKMQVLAKEITAIREKSRDA